jgi:hypothetical protein
LKDEEAMIDAKGFRGFHWTKGTSSREVMEAHQGRWIVCMWEEKKEEDEV